MSAEYVWVFSSYELYILIQVFWWHDGVVSVQASRHVFYFTFLTIGTCWTDLRRMCFWTNFNTFPCLAAKLSKCNAIRDFYFILFYLIIRYKAWNFSWYLWFMNVNKSCLKQPKRPIWKILKKILPAIHNWVSYYWDSDLFECRTYMVEVPIKNTTHYLPFHLHPL